MNNEIEKIYNSVVENETDYVNLRGKKVGIKWMHPGTQRKLSNIILKYKDDDTLQHRCAAVCVLNSFFKILFLYPILWRWYFFVKEYSANEMYEIFEVSKKKVQQESSLKNMVLLIGVRDTLKQQTMTSVESILQKLLSEQSTQSKED